MKDSPLPAKRYGKPSIRAFTLVETMAATLIFALSAAGLTSLYIQSLRFSTWQVNNVHITNTSFSIADQIRNIGANQLFAAYVAANSGTPIPLTVVTVEPNDPNDGYKTVNLPINQKNADVVNPYWTTVSLKLGRLTTSPTILTDYWITIRRNISAPGAAPAFDVLECTILYRWGGNDGKSKTLGQIQLTFPAPNLTFGQPIP